MTDDNNKPDASKQSIPSSVNPDAEPVEQPYQEEQYAVCDICEGHVDMFLGNHYKSHDDETFRHILCHENGKPPEEYAFKMTDTDLCCTNRQYNCGHLIYAPQRLQPRHCPECNDLEWDGEEWSPSGK